MKNLFDHRINNTHATSIIDAVNASAARAIGVVNLVWAQFEEDGGRMNDKIIQGALDSIECEVRDMKKFANLLWEQKKTD